MENLNLCAMTFSKAFEEGGRISCFFTFAYHVLIPKFSFFNFPWAWVEEAQRVMTGYWEFIVDEKCGLQTQL